MSDSHADISKHVKSYIRVFVTLAVLTIVTVLAAQIKFPGAGNEIIMFVIAVVKATLVAAIFMHLRWERSVSIWWALAFCVVFFAVLMLLPVLTNQDSPPQVQHSMWG